MLFRSILDLIARDIAQSAEESSQENTKKVTDSVTLGSAVRIGSNRGRTYKRGSGCGLSDSRGVCALHHTCVPYLSDRRFAILSRRRGGNLVDIHTSCI